MAAPAVRRGVLVGAAKFAAVRSLTQTDHLGRQACGSYCLGLSDTCPRKPQCRGPHRPEGRCRTSLGGGNRGARRGGDQSRGLWRLRVPMAVNAVVLGVRHRSSWRLSTIPASHMGVHGRSHRVCGHVIAVLAASGAALPGRRLHRAVPATVWRVEVSVHCPGCGGARID